MKNIKMTICLIAAVLVMAASQGFGYIEYKDGGTHNINSTINDDAVMVDWYAPSMQTTVNVLEGGNILAPYGLKGYNDSRLNMSGGFVNSIAVTDSAQVTLSGGIVNEFGAFSSNQVTMSGGFVNFLDLSGSSQVTMSGVRVIDLYTYNSSQVTMSSGSVNNLFVCHNSQVTISGGTIGYDLSLLQNAELIIYGSNFAIDENPVGFGEITSILGGIYRDEPSRLLTGTLANGDAFNNHFKIGDYASITLVPEPATLLLLGLGAVVLRRKR